MTFSIVARDRKTGAVGVATATGGPVVGSLVPYARAGVGAVATQGYTNPFYGFDGLSALETGEAAPDVIARLTKADSQQERRQVIAVDREGRAGGWTGNALNDFRGMALETGVAVAGNLLTGEPVLIAMMDAFADSEGRPLEERLLAAMRAGEAEGGDRRGTRSAALKTYTDQAYPEYDMRIDFSDRPIDRLADLLGEVKRGQYADFFVDVPRR